MKVVELPLQQLEDAPWNANRMDGMMMAKLRESIRRFGFVQNLVVRPIGENTYEVLSGNQRLKLLRESNSTPVPCVVVHLDDAHACLLAQALNRIQGEDDLGLRAELVREVLKSISANEVLSLLPETTESLKALGSMGLETVATYLENWQQTRQARMRHLQFQLMANQLEVVEEALARVMPSAFRAQGGSPNRRGTALYLLCKSFLERDNNER